MPPRVVKCDHCARWARDPHDGQRSSSVRVGSNFPTFRYVCASCVGAHPLMIVHTPRTLSPAGAERFDAFVDSVETLGNRMRQMCDEGCAELNE